jgi:hypothetical protein
VPVSGLVVSLSDEPQPLAAALAAIGREKRITMGVFEANRLAIVLDTASSDEDRQLWEWLGSLPGVSFIEVAFVGFERPDESPPVRTRNAHNNFVDINIDSATENDTM